LSLSLGKLSVLGFSGCGGGSVGLNHALNASALSERGSDSHKDHNKFLLLGKLGFDAEHVSI
jgi:hypothetical protein